MLKRIMTAAALAAVLLTPAFAQSGSQPSNDVATGASSMQPAIHGSTHASFLNAQNSNEWRSSKLVGANVYGSDNKKIGDINDLLVDTSGNIRAAVIGVGGFIGVGEKNVAVPFDTLTITRKADGKAIDKITVSYSEDELSNAPKFAWYEGTGVVRQTTGSSNMSKSAPAPSGVPAKSQPLNPPSSNNYK